MLLRKLLSIFHKSKDNTNYYVVNGSFINKKNDPFTHIRKITPCHKAIFVNPKGDLNSVRIQSKR